MHKPVPILSPSPDIIPNGTRTDASVEAVNDLKTHAGGVKETPYTCRRRFHLIPLYSSTPNFLITCCSQNPQGLGPWGGPSPLKAKAPCPIQRDIFLYLSRFGQETRASSWFAMCTTVVSESWMRSHSFQRVNPLGKIATTAISARAERTSIRGRGQMFLLPKHDILLWRRGSAGDSPT